MNSQVLSVLHPELQSKSDKVQQKGILEYTTWEVKDKL